MKIHGYPNLALIGNSSAELCLTEYENVQVLGAYPSNRPYQEVGYVDVKQTGDEFTYTSQEKQIEKARMLACEWEADAIVILGAANKEHTSWWDGSKSHTESHRIAAIRYLPQN